ncbi:MAG: erythromycin esterase family protein [Halobacterium sp.]
MTRQRPPTDLLDSLRDHSVALEPTSPDADYGDLRAFDPVFEGVDVVGLGEATHRTREFVHLKGRLVRYLADVHGFGALALEAPFSETVALDAYVREGAGALHECVAALGLSMYETAEALACFESLRAYNEGRPRQERIAVYGIDVQSAAGAAAALREWLLGDDTDADRPAFRDDRLLDDLDRVADGVFTGEDVDTDRLRAAERVADALAAWFEAERDGDAERDGGAERDGSGAAAALARRHVRTLQQACAFARTGVEADRTAQWGLRDEFMAENAAWVRDHAATGGVAVWAHNNHVKTGRLGGDGHPSRTTGDRLAARYGDGYYALGAQFATGSVRAYAPTDGDGVEYDGATLAMTELSVPEPDGGAVPGLLAEIDAPALLLDYRSLPADSPLRDWLAAERPHRSVAGIVHPDDEDAFSRTHRSLDVFDGVFFVDEATPTTPL